MQNRKEFDKSIKLDKKDFSAIEYLLRKGQRQLEVYKAPGIRDIRWSMQTLWMLESRGFKWQDLGYFWRKARLDGCATSWYFELAVSQLLKTNIYFTMHRIIRWRRMTRRRSSHSSRVLRKQKQARDNIDVFGTWFHRSPQLDFNNLLSYELWKIPPLWLNTDNS